MSFYSRFIEPLQAGTSLDESESYACLTSIFKSEVEDDQIIALLTAMSQKGETVSELVGFAKAMRDHMVNVPLSQPGIDVCGTGGIQKDRFNVSTAISFFLPLLDVPVAKHGNRGSRAANGSFDFLESLGIPFFSDPKDLSAQYEKFGLIFLFARNHHPAMKAVAGARKAFGQRSFFNLLGPLCNPASVDFQIVGTVSENKATLLAQVLQRLGTKKSLVITSEDGYDDLSVTHVSQVLEVTPDQIQSFSFDPSVLNITFEDSPRLGGESEENASLFRDMLENASAHPFLRALMALNAGAALYCYGKASSIEEGYEKAKQTLDDPMSLQTFFADYALSLRNNALQKSLT